MCNLDLTDEQSKAAILGFRRDNPKIVQFWRSFDETIRRSVLDKEKKIEIQMPTGDYLRHFHVRPFTRRIGARVSSGYESYTTYQDFSATSHQKNLWGGVLTENVTQRMARDILAEGLVRCRRAGILPVFSSHDEGIFEVDDTPSSRKEALEEATRLLTLCPEWCEGLPLGVEGGFESRYTKQL
jgi:DNA polymerase